MTEIDLWQVPELTFYAGTHFFRESQHFFLVPEIDFGESRHSILVQELYFGRVPAFTFCAGTRYLANFEIHLICLISEKFKSFEIVELKKYFMHL